MTVQVITDPEFIARIKAKSVRAPERDVPPDLECWREGDSKEHYFLRGAYMDTLSWIPGMKQPASSEQKGCGAKLAPDQWWGFCGETDMGQTLPALCTKCGGEFKPA